MNWKHNVISGTLDRNAFLKCLDFLRKVFSSILFNFSDYCAPQTKETADKGTD